MDEETHDPIGILDERTRRLRNRDITKYWEETTWKSTTFTRELGLIEVNNRHGARRNVTT